MNEKSLRPCCLSAKGTKACNNRFSAVPPGFRRTAAGRRRRLMPVTGLRPSRTTKGAKPLLPAGRSRANFGKLPSKGLAAGGPFLCRGPKTGAHPEDFAYFSLSQRLTNHLFSIAQNHNLSSNHSRILPPGAQGGIIKENRRQEEPPCSA